MDRATRILVVDDHPIFRAGLAATIEKDKELVVVGEADNGAEALEMIAETKPDVIILDIDMPILDGIETARELKRRALDIQTIFLTMHKDNLILRSIRSLGVKGYVLKDSALNEIVSCIRSVTAGKTYLSPALNDLILESVGLPNSDDSFPKINSLTQAEKKVLSLITESKTNREMATELFVTIRTIETHRYNICLKLNLNGAHALFKFALQNRKRILELLGE